MVARSTGSKVALDASALPDASNLPYREPLLKYLRGEAGRGRRLVLLTDADEGFARAIAAHLGLFDDVVAAAGRPGPGGASLLQKLRAACGPVFDCAGGTAADRELFEAARRAVVVGAGVRPRAGGTPIEREFPDEGGHLRGAYRHCACTSGSRTSWSLHLWSRTKFTDISLLGDAALAFFAFCACASAVYVLNDLLDIAADRRHPRKRKRAFASGAVPPAQGVLLSLILVAVAFGLGAVLPPAFLVCSSSMLDRLWPTR